MKKRHPEHVNLERWLVSYADFITLLFAFFVVMYAISQADMAKFRKVSVGLKNAFHSAGGGIGLDGENTGNSLSPVGGDIPSTGGRAINMPSGKTNTAADPDSDLQETKEMLEEAVSLEMGSADLSNQIQMLFDSRGLVVRLAIKDFFGPNETQINPDLRPLLDRIGGVIAKSHRAIRIEGHSDQAELDGWETSTARAMALTKYWLKRFNLNPARVGIAGYSHFQPLSQGDSAGSRGKNRRVEVIILNNLYSK